MESVKMKKATKTVAFRQLAIYCNIFDNQLLTDTEMFKDITKYLVRRNFPYNVAQVEDTFTQILRDKVAG